MNIPVVDFPKIESPFVREMIGRKYLATREVAHDWIWDPGVCAVDKIDGTNICVHVRDGSVTCVDNRENRLGDLLSVTGSKYEGKLLEGIANAIGRGWLKKADRLLMPMQLKDVCQHCGHGGPGDVTSIYGELVGPSINSNRHQLTQHLFVPFQHLAEKCAWGAWHDRSCFPKGGYDDLRQWFKDLPSLFSRRMRYPEILAEGLVFHHPDGRLCKLRRDMFDYKETT